MRLNRKHIIVATCWLLLFVAMLLFYGLFYKYHLFIQEQNQLFLNSSDWLNTYFDKPAWLGCMAGEWLTQYYYYLWSGPCILSGILTLTTYLLYRSLKRCHLPQRAVILITIASTICLFGSTLHTYSTLSPLICVLGGLAIFMLSGPLRAWGVLLIIPAYWLFGLGSLVLALLYAIYAFRQTAKRMAVTISLTALLAFGTPAILMRSYTLPYDKALTYPGIKRPILPEWSRESTYAVECEHYFGNSDKAMDLALSVKSPNSVTAFYYYLEAAKRDILPDLLLTYPLKDLGTLNQIGEQTPVPVINMMNDLYYELGDMMYAERAAMMRNVFSPNNRNARMIKRLAEINIIKNDTAAALKHLRMLERTVAYRDWAKTHTTGQMSARAYDELITKRQKFVNTQDTMRLGDNCRTILIELLESNPANTIALDYLLCTDLLLLEMDTFKSDYDRFCLETGRPRVKKTYQEALAIYLAGTNAAPQEWERYITMPELMPRFVEYNKHRGNPEFSDTYWYYFDKKNKF